MKKALLLLADGFEEIEALSPVDYLRRAGCQVFILGLGKERSFSQGAHGINVLADKAFDSFLNDFSFDFEGIARAYDAIVIPGGMPGATNIASNENAVSLIKAFVKEEKLVACICASPALVLPQTGALDGKKWTCYPGMQENVKSKELLSCYQDAPFLHDSFLITGRGPGAAEEFSMEIVKSLCGTEIYLKVKGQSLQR